MNRTLKELAFNSAHEAGLFRSLHFWDISSASSVYILVYHRVDWENAQPHLDPGNLSATPEQFERQMQLLAREYHPVTAEDLLSAARCDKKLPSRAVLVTVDDGYRDFKQHLWPIANRHGIRPILFVATAHIGTGVFWWDKLYDALERTTLKEINTPAGVLPLTSAENRLNAFAGLAYYMKTAPFDSAIDMVTELCRKLVDEPLARERITLDWDELRELAKAGVTIAPHTHTHPALGNINPAQARFEITESQRLIAAEIGSPCPLFAYSYGLPEAIGEQSGKILKETGCELAFTMTPGRASLKYDDRMYLPRIEVNPSLTLAHLHARLTVAYDISTRKNRKVHQAN